MKDYLPNTAKGCTPKYVYVGVRTEDSAAAAAYQCFFQDSGECVVWECVQKALSPELLPNPMPIGSSIQKAGALAGTKKIKKNYLYIYYG